MIRISQTRPLEAILQNGNEEYSIRLIENPSSSIRLNDLFSLPDTARRIVDSFLAFYLLGDNIPPPEINKVRINFPLDSSCLEWFRGLYNYWKRPFPELESEVQDFDPLTPSLNKKDKRLLAFSGGKDSTYLAIKNDVLPVHILGLNSKFKARELNAVNNLSRYINNTSILIPIENKNVLFGDIGYQVRDGLIYTLIASAGLKLNASEILSGSYIEGPWYGESKEGIDKLNKILLKKGFESQVSVIKNLDEEDVIRNIIEINPEILNFTSSCVVSEPDFSEFRRRYNKDFSDPPLLSDSCGLCGKCAEINMARMLFDPKLSLTYTDSRIKLVRYYLERFSKSRPFRDLIETNLLNKVAQKYLNDYNSSQIVENLQ